MGSIYHGRKTMLYSDLFKPNRNIVLEKEDNIMMPKLQGSSSSSSLSSNESFSYDSSSMGFSSELGSPENDDGDFMAELLARQMAECMLQDEEQEEEKKASGSLRDYNNLKCVFEPNQVRKHDVKVYELKNQPPLRKERVVNRGRRVKGTESTHSKQVEKTEEIYMQMQYRGREWGRMRRDGSGMQAIFLDGSKSRTGSSGTGVFLPPATNDPVKPKRKSGCSTVLIPTRVLHTLDLHFNRRLDSVAPPATASGASPDHSCRKDKSNGLSQLGNRPANHDVEMQLPQEWTY